MNRINIHQIPFQPNLSKPKNLIAQPNTSFAKYLEEITTTNDTLKISKHANERMQLRDISISDHEWEAISTKVSEAKSKGVNQPLVLLEQAALIISAKNNTVITALDRQEAREQLFTNIDGTIVL